MVSDHFRRTTIKRLASERLGLRFGCCDWMVKSLLDCGVSQYRIDVYDLDTPFTYPDFSVMAFPLVHNVPNCGYHISGDGWSGSDGACIFYATDTNNMDDISAPGYDLYLIEANYTEADIVERIRRKGESGEHVYEWGVLENHLSYEKAMDWLYRQMGPDSQYVLLHEHSD